MHTSIFFYGTLMHPKVIKKVLQNDGSYLKFCPAILLGYTRHKVKWRDYPGALPCHQSQVIYKRELTPEERSIRGTLVTGLTDEDMGMLDEFEGDEYVRKKDLDIYPLGPLVNLSTYDADDEAALVEALSDQGTLPENLPPPVKAETYIYAAGVRYLKAEAWSFSDFVVKAAFKWYRDPDARWAALELPEDEGH